MQRLFQQLLRGDLSVADPLRTALARSGDQVAGLLCQAQQTGPEALAFVIAGLDALDLAVEQAAVAWQAEDWSVLGQWTAGLGFVLHAQDAAKIDARIQAANRGRRARKVNRRMALRALALALRAHEGYGFEHAGKAHGATGACFAALRSDGAHVTVGASVCNARQLNPSSGFRELSPWSSKSPDQNTRKARAWASGTEGRVTLEVVPLPRALQPSSNPSDPPADAVAKLLADPSRSNFNKLVSLLNKAPAKARDALLQRLQTGLTHWPDLHRAATKRTLASIKADHRKGSWRPGPQLCTGLDITGVVDDPTLEALTASPWVSGWTWLKIDEADAQHTGTCSENPTVRLLSLPDWSGLQTLTLGLNWSFALSEYIGESRALRQVTHLTLRPTGNGWYDELSDVEPVVSGCQALETLVVESISSLVAQTPARARMLIGHLEALPALHTLDFGLALAEPGVAALTRSPLMIRLQSLRLNGTMAKPETFAGWVEQPRIGVQTLELLGVTPNVMPHLVRAPLHAVRTLRLGTSEDPEIHPLNDSLQAVRTLRLGTSEDLELHPLGSSPLMQGLESLRLAALGPRLAPLLEASDLGQLQVLWLNKADKNALAVVERLVRGGALQTLHVPDCRAPARLFELMQNSAGTNLGTLDVSYLDLRPHFEQFVKVVPPGLRRLVVHRCYLSSEQLRTLQRQPGLRDTEIQG